MAHLYKKIVIDFIYVFYFREYNPKILIHASITVKKDRTGDSFLIFNFFNPISFQYFFEENMEIDARIVAFIFLALECF